jgi:hypothetical protein
MREIARHGIGRVFLAVLALSVIAMLAAPALFGQPRLYCGWMPLPFAIGVVFLLVWLVAYLVYFFGYWPFRK